MSLYAHNQELLRDTGDSVERGEIISRAGNTGACLTPLFTLRYAKMANRLIPKAGYKVRAPYRKK